MIRARFEGGGWRTRELLYEMSHCDNFYFDQLCQVRMESWTKGRVALVGDAGYCPSSAAGMGGSTAILGAATLADALHKHPGDLRAAFQEYDESFRPTVGGIQANAVEFGGWSVTRHGAAKVPGDRDCAVFRSAGPNRLIKLYTFTHNRKVQGSP